LFGELCQLVPSSRLTERTIRGEEVRVRIAAISALIDCMSVPGRQLSDFDVVDRRESHGPARRWIALLRFNDDERQDTSAE
jgi:hypothetical protein